jgi:hypothetical protein
VEESYSQLTHELDQANGKNKAMSKREKGGTKQTYIQLCERLSGADGFTAAGFTQGTAIFMAAARVRKTGVTLGRGNGSARTITSRGPA